MRLSIIWFAAILTIPLFSASASSSETRAQMPEMIGEIPAGSGAVTGISFGSITQIDIDPDLVARGDRLDIYKIADDGSSVARRKPVLKRVGSLVVISGSESPPAGKVIRLSEEINGKTFVAFTLPVSRQLNQYLPFIKSMADSFPVKSEFKPLKIALIDAINPFGDRTALTDALFEKVIQRVCERQQFLCADRRDVTTVLRNHQITTSRNIDSSAERELLSKLDVEVIVTGHVLRRENKIVFLLRARSTRSNAEPRQVWRLFRLPDSAAATNLPGPDRITHLNVASKKGWLNVRFIDVLTADGMSVEYFFHEALLDYSGASGLSVKSARPVDIFVKLNGAVYNQDGNGLFYSGPVKAGKIEITAGYYPAVTIDGETKKLSESPVRKTFTIYVGEGDNFYLNIIGTVEKGFAIIAADSYLSKSRI